MSSVAMRGFYLSRKTTIKANKTKAQRMPPSPSKMVDIRATNLDTEWNRLPKNWNNHSRDKNLEKDEIVVG
jgi:hypothetical protein